MCIRDRTVASPTFLSDGLAHNKALVVHEMTHALTDYHGEQLSTLVSETCAYIAQMMYVRVNDLDIDGFLNPVHDFRLKNIFQIAWAIADTIISTPSYEVSPNSATALAQAISEVPVYASAAATTTSYDGI